MKKTFATPGGSFDVSSSRALRKLSEVPGPRGMPLLGNALDINPKELHRLVSGWADRFGPLFVFRVATQSILTICDADIIQKILRDRPHNFRRWRKVEELLTEIGANGVFSAEGESWRRQRKFVMYALNAGHVRDFIPRMEEVVGRLRRHWWRAALTGTPVNVLQDLRRLTVDVTSGLAFGRDFNTLEQKAEPIQKYLDKLLPAIARRQTALFPYWRYVQLPADREVAFAVKEVRKFIDGLIADARARIAVNPDQRAKPTNLLEAMIASHDNDEQGPTDEEISANVMTMLLAGEDTTANTLAYMIHFLKEHPPVQAAAQEEVDRVIGMAEQPWSDPAMGDRLRYIEALIHETMRCKPIGAHVFLEPNRDVEIEGVFVPKGTPILALSGDVGLQEENFTDAREFLPQRWLQFGNDYEGQHNAKAFMPFGAGPRFCPGRLLAMLQIKMVAAMLCRDFEVAHPRDAQPLHDEYGFTVGPTNIQAVLRPRRTLRFGVDLDLRIGDRREVALPIKFPDRRVGDRRSRQASAA